MPVELGFTSHLVETLHSCRTKLDAYAVRKKAAMDADVQALEQERQKNQDLIGNHVRNLQAVQSERGFASEEGIAQRRRDLNSQQRQLQERIQELTKEQEEQEQIAQDLENQVQIHRSKAEQVRQQKARVADAKKTTVDDLTRGLVNYKYLGFDFVKSGNGLRFTFTQLDAGDPDRTFGFTLVANLEDAYEVHDCDSLDEATVDMLVGELNESDDLSAFMLQMRRAFCDTIH